MTPEQKIMWDAVERVRRAPVRRTYQVRTCLVCGHTISEGAFSGRDGNWRKHTESCSKESVKEG